MNKFDINISRQKDVLDMKNEVGPKYVIFMVGLPARGKSYICKKLARYLSWSGFTTKVFNVGNRRRTASEAKATKETSIHDAKFFEHTNPEAAAVREKLALDTLEDMIDWLKDGGKVAIHDATNSTIARRQALRDRVSKEQHFKAFFIESICPNKELLEQNIKMKLQGPDYVNMKPEDAIKDFKARIANYEKVYQTICEQEEESKLSYIKIIDVGNKVIAHRIKGYLPSQCVSYLMQMNISKRSIWLTRHGESEYNALGKIGGDSHLTDRGKGYAKALYEFMEEHQFEVPEKDYEKQHDSTWSLSAPPKLQIFTSTLQRTIETVQFFEHYQKFHIKFLNEIYSGKFEDMTYAEIEKNYPEEYISRLNNKLNYRYPGAGGESYVDVIERLKPIITEIERMRIDCVVVTHQVVMRTLLAYFNGVPLEKLPKIKVPLHMLYCLQPKPYGADLKRYLLNPETGQIEYVGEGLEFLE